MRWRLVLFSTLIATHLPTHAQVRRCVTPDAQTVYTDRRCSELGAEEAKARQAQVQPRNYRAACPRTLRDLVFELTNAIDTRDGNRLVALYNWTGMGTKRAYDVVARLDALAQRPLAQVVPVYPRGPEGEDPLLYPQTTVRRAPVALRLEQTLPGTATPARTVFGLQQYFGCWWIRG